MTATRSPKPKTSRRRHTPLTHIAAGVNGYPEGEDAAALGAALATATGGNLTLVAVHPEPLVVLPSGMDFTTMRKQARAMLASARDKYAPDARLTVRTDLSVARALHRVVRDQHRDLLVLGSSRHAADGHVRIGKRTRQLLGQFECALAIAPRGVHERPDLTVGRIGVGYDGTREAGAALAAAQAIAVAAGAELHVCGVVDDRMLAFGYSHVWLGDMMQEWQQIVAEELARLDKQMRAAASMDAKLTVSAVPGRPADALLELSEKLDLLVIGSRRWGPAARVLLGSTGEAVLHDAACPVIAVPRPGR